MRTALGPAAMLLGGLLSGCATGQSTSITGRLIRPGEPALDLGGPPIDVSHSENVRQLEAEGRARSGAFGTTIEDSDPQLAAALLVEAAWPTAANHVRVAEEYRRLGVFDAAYGRLRRAVAKEPRMAEAHAGIARAWRDWGYPERGLSAAYRAAFFDRNSAGVQNTLGTVLDALGQLEEAREAYQRALALDRSAAWALNNVCYVEFRLGRLQEARWSCEEALRLAPGQVATHNNLAMIHAAAGDLARAREEFLAAGDSAAAHYNLGIMHLAIGDYVAAAEAFEAAIEARPSFTAAKARAHAARRRLLTGSH